MRRSALLLVASLFTLLAGTASADSVLMACSEGCPQALFEALELELRGHGGILVARPGLAGFTPGARSAEAMRLTQLLGVAATLWVEPDAPLRLRVFSDRTKQISEAPLALPLDQIEPRIFAATAGSVVLEALTAPGPEPITESVAPPSPEPTPATEPPGVPQPISTAARETWPAAHKNETWSKRFFVRMGVALGQAWLGQGATPNRPPSSALVHAAASMANWEPAEVEAFLRANGYDCDVEDVTVADGERALAAANCRVAVQATGRVNVPAIDLVAGLNITPRLALALTARIDPNHGMSTQTGSVYGLQAECQLTRPAAAGFWTSAVLGLGVGRIQARLPDVSRNVPYAISGPGNVRGGFLLGYRLVPRVGLVFAPILHFMFPDKLWVVDSTLSLEVRI